MTMNHTPQYDPYPATPPQKNMAKVAGGWALAAIAVLFTLGALSSLVNGHTPDAGGARMFGRFLGYLLFIALPAWGAVRLLGSHKRELASWTAQQDELARQRRLTGGF